MKKKLLQAGLVKGLLVGLLCCVLLGSGAFSGKALAGPTGGSYDITISSSPLASGIAVQDVGESFRDLLELYVQLDVINAEEADTFALEAQAAANDRGHQGGYSIIYTRAIKGTTSEGEEIDTLVEVWCITPWDNGGDDPDPDPDPDPEEKTSSTSQALRESSAALNLAYLMSINNLSKRMGDLRGGEASNIPWFRFSRNNNTMGSLGYNGNTYQVGYDREIARDKNSRQLLGISLDINDGTTKLTNGSGKMQGFSVGLYYTKIYESGHYFDFIFRQGRLGDDVKTFDITAKYPYTAFDYDINATTLSGEYGYRFKLGKSGFYLEPQAELIYGYLSSANITTNNNESLKLESSNKFISRVGLAFGKRKNNINYYARVSQFYDWGSAKSTVVQDGTASSVDLAKNWWEVSLGGGWHMSDMSYFYAEISKQYKDIQNSLNFNLGFRFSL